MDLIIIIIIIIIERFWVLFLFQEGHDCEEKEYCPYLHEVYSQVMF